MVVKYAGAQAGKPFSQSVYATLLKVGLKILSGKKDLRAAIRTFLPSGVIGMKTNCLARRFNSTPVALTSALVELLTASGFDQNDIVIWERTSEELKKGGYTLNASSFGGLRCFGTDTRGIGYSDDFYSYGEVNSLVSRILTEVVDYNVNLPVLKDHSIAGLSGALKNMYGAINNPNKYHDNNCDPFCAHINLLAPIKKKNRLTVLDAVKVQYNGGPGYVAQYISFYSGIILSADAVAADRVGLEILENERKKHGLPPLEKVGRQVKYLATAQKEGLGTADLSEIDLVVVRVDADGKQAKGELF